MRNFFMKIIHRIVTSYKSWRKGYERAKQAKLLELLIPSADTQVDKRKVAKRLRQANGKYHAATLLYLQENPDGDVFGFDLLSLEDKKRYLDLADDLT